MLSAEEIGLRLLPRGPLTNERVAFLPVDEQRPTRNMYPLDATKEEIDAFLADTSADAYEKVVDRLLLSPRYGEHMAARWLDAARYADSHGFQTDSISKSSCLELV